MPERKTGQVQYLPCFVVLVDYYVVYDVVY